MKFLITYIDGQTETVEADNFKSSEGFIELYNEERGLGGYTKYPWMATFSWTQVRSIKNKTVL